MLGNSPIACHTAILFIGEDRGSREGDLVTEFPFQLRALQTLRSIGHVALLHTQDNPVPLRPAARSESAEQKAWVDVMDIQVTIVYNIIEDSMLVTAIGPTGAFALRFIDSLLS